MQVKELGHIVLYVRNAERSAAFYRDVLGWRQIEPPAGAGRQVAFFTTGRSHHELLLIEVGEDAAPQASGNHIGLYHFGIKIGTTDDELREAIATLQANNVTMVGASDHGVTHSLYIRDPDGNEIELYIDVQPELWHEHPEAVITPTRPLRI